MMVGLEEYPNYFISCGAFRHEAYLQIYMVLPLDSDQHSFYCSLPNKGLLIFSFILLTITRIRLSPRPVPLYLHFLSILSSHSSLRIVH